MQDSDYPAPPTGPPTVVCTACLSPDVVAMDSTGAAVCLRHRATELESLELQRDIAVALLEKVVFFVVEEEGMIHPADAVKAVGEAVDVAAETRRRLGVREVPTIRETQQAADALYEYEVGGDR